MNAKIKFIGVAAAILIALLSLLALLQVHRFKQLLLEVISALISVPALGLKSDVERTLAFGLPLQSNAQLAQMLEKTNQQYESILSIHLIDADLDAGKVLWESGPKLLDPVRAASYQRRSPKALWFDASDPSGYIIGWPITDPLDRLAASLAVRFDKEKPRELIEQAALYVSIVWVIISVFLTLILTPVLIKVVTRLDTLIEHAKSTINGSRSSTMPADERSEIAYLAEEIAAAAEAAATTDDPYIGPQPAEQNPGLLV